MKRDIGVQVGDYSASEQEDPNSKGVQTDSRLIQKNTRLPNVMSSDEEIERRIHEQLSKVRSQSRDR